MSNPGVISLAVNSKFNLKIEDNIGEAIHLHYGNIRLDLTVEEFEKIANCMNNIIDGIVSVKDFSSRNINPEDLCQISALLPQLLRIEKDEIFLNELLVNTNYGKYIPLKKIKKTNDSKICSQNDQVILFGNNNFVICGQEQCKNLYIFSGNIKIPVFRMFFDKTVTIKNFQKKQPKVSLIKQFFKIIKWIIRHFKSIFN